MPCLLALGCSLEVAGSGSGRPGLEAGTEAVEGGRQPPPVDAGAPDADGEGEVDSPDAARPVTDAGGRRDAGPDASTATDASAPDASPEARLDASMGRDAAMMQVETCDLAGRFALRIAFDVTWVGTEFLSIVPVIESGQGELSFIVLMELAPSAAGFDAAFRACSSDVPEFVAAISRERYQARIEDEVWDSAAMPLFSTTLETSCLEPGCAFGGEPLRALVGAALRRPDAPWPGQPAAGEWPDHDGNGEPGIATRMFGPADGAYAYPPLDLLSVRRLRQLALGLRVVVGFDGTLDSCDAISGETTQSGIETRAVGCTASSAPLSCTADELAFLNNNLPVWTPQRGSFEARRLPDSATCDAARGAFARPRP